MKEDSKFIKWFKTKDLSDAFLAGSFLCTLLSLILYCTTGTNEFATSLSSVLIAFLAVSLVLQLGLFYFGSKAGKYLSYLLLLYAFFYFIYTQITYIANVFVSIDGNSFSGGFIATIIFLLLAWALSLVAGILAKDEEDLIRSMKHESH